MNNEQKEAVIKQLKELREVAEKNEYFSAKWFNYFLVALGFNIVIICSSLFLAWLISHVGKDGLEQILLRALPYSLLLLPLWIVVAKVLSMHEEPVSEAKLKLMLYEWGLESWSEDEDKEALKQRLERSKEQIIAQLKTLRALAESSKKWCYGFGVAAVSMLVFSLLLIIALIACLFPLIDKTGNVGYLWLFTASFGFLFTLQGIWETSGEAPVLVEVISPDELQLRIYQLGLESLPEVGVEDEVKTFDEKGTFPY